MVEKHSDEELAARAAMGDTRALGVLVQRYRSRVYAITLRATGRTEVADELFQETWTRVARRIPTFDPARPFSKWMLSIAINLSIDHARRTTVRRGEQLSTPADVEAAPGRATPADHELMAEEERLQVAAALQKLPEAMRTAVLMRYFEDQSEQAMATVLEVPAGTVKSRLHHALKKLRAQLQRTS